MVESIPSLEYVAIWGSIRECSVFNGACDGSSLTEIMMVDPPTVYNQRIEDNFYCIKCYRSFRSKSQNKFLRAIVNDTKYKCPEKNCGARLSFHEFFAGTCCNKAKIEKERKDKKEEFIRTEFKDLKKMMILLEQSEKKEKEAKEKTDTNAKIYERSITSYNEKKKKREESQANLASSLTNTGMDIAEDKGDKSAEAKLGELKIILGNHGIKANEEKVSKKKMEANKKALDEATADFTKKGEEREQVQSDLSSTFADTAKELALNGEVQENEIDKCNVCFEKYNKLDRHSCVLQCGHLTCRKCLDQLAEKICPSCRKPFTESDIIKIYLKL